MDTVVQRGGVAPNAVTPEPAIQLADFFRRPVRTGVWQVSATGVVPLTSMATLFEQWQQVTAVARKLTGFRLFRGEPEVTFIYSGNPTARGTVVFYLYPRVPYSYMNTIPDEPAWVLTPNASYFPSYMQFPHIQINLEEACTCKMKLPWSQNVGMSRIDLLQDWYVRAIVMNSPLNNDGSTFRPMTIDMYLSYNDVLLSSPVIVEGNVENDGWLSSKLAYGAGILSTVSSVFPFVTPWAMIAKGAAGVASSLGYSLPIATPMTSVVSRRTTTLSYLSGGIDVGQKLSVDPAVALDVSRARIPMGTLKDTNVSALCSKWGLIAYDVDLYAARVFTISPLVCAPTDTSVSVYSPIFVPTPLGFVSSLFLHWSGDIELKFEFVSNALIRARYAIQVIPNGYPVPATYEPYSQYRTTTVEVVGRTEALVTVPYEYSANYQDNFYFTIAAANDITRVRVVVFELDAVQGTPAGAPYLYMNVYIRAGNNFSLARPTMNVMKGYCTNLPRNTAPLSAPIEAEEGTEVSRVIVEGANDDGTLNAYVFGENIQDLNLLLRRPCYNATFQVSTVSTIDFVVIPLPGFRATQLTNVGVTGAGIQPILLSSLAMTYVDYISRAYLGSTGGYRHKILGGAGDEVLMAAQIFDYVGRGNMLTRYPPASTATTAAPTSYVFSAPLVMARMNDHESLMEVEFPSVIPQGFNAAGRTGKSDNTNQVEAGIYFGCSNSADRRLFVSGAEDYTVGGFLCAPPVRSYAVI